MGGHAGIVGTLVGTLAGAVLTPVITETVRRKSARKERLLELRLVTYADLLRSAGRLVANARELASTPEAEFPEAL
jgi:hypothetical protein